MPEQLRQNAHTARLQAHIEHPVFLVVNRHVWVGSSSKPSAKNSIHASRTVSAPPSTGPMDFMEEWIRMVSLPVSPIAARSCLRSAFVYAMSFLLFGHFVCTQFTAFCAAKQADTQKGTYPAASAGVCAFQLFSVVSGYSPSSSLQHRVRPDRSSSSFRAFWKCHISLPRMIML